MLPAVAVAGGAIRIVATVPTVLEAPSLAIHATVRVGAATIEMTVRPLAPAIHALVDPVSATVEAVLDAIALAIQVLCRPVAAFGLESRGTPVQAPVYCLAAGIHAVIDPVTAPIQALLLAVAAIVELAFDPVTALVEAVFHPVSEIRVCGQSRDQGQYRPQQQAPLRYVHVHVSSISQCDFTRVTEDNARRRRPLTQVPQADRSPTMERWRGKAPDEPKSFFLLVTQAHQRPNI
jgi:hypothetical protein